MVFVVTIGLMTNIKRADKRNYEDALSTAIGKMKKKRLSLVVMKGKKYYGMLDDRDIWGRYPANTKAGGLAVKTPRLSRDSGVFDAAECFTTGKFKALPVIEKSKIVGIITRADLMRELSKEDVLVRARAKDVMGSPAITIDVKETVAQARARMRRARITHLVVTQKGKAVGSFSTYDFVVSSSRPRERLPFVREKLSVDTQPVGSFFRKLDGIGREATLKECALRMAEHDISELVVVEDGSPKGIVVANDIFRLMTSEPEAIVEVSGLSGEDKQYMQDVVEQARKVLAKLGKEFDIERLTMHVKKYGRKYSIHAKLKGRKTVAVSGHAWDLYSAVKQVLNEVKKVLMKGKRSKKGGRRNRKGSP